jgi:hypothetical protein
VCGNACATPTNTTALCSASTCAWICKAGYYDCNKVASDGCEIDATSDVNNCGGCGVICPTPPNATPTCSGTGCGFTCVAGYADCTAAPGCETDITTDTDCGSCGNTCGTGTTCKSGSCSP